MPSNALADRVEGLVHEGTQVRDGGVDLTVAAVHRVAEPGRLDFGGGELVDATLAPVETALRNPDDDYGWWNLSEGQYVVTFNERLAGDDPDPVRVEPRRELARRGGALPTVTTVDLGPLPLSTPTGAGDVALRVKENARIATARPP